MYIVTYQFGNYWTETLEFSNKQRCLAWLSNGFQPTDCEIFVNGKRWNSDADYAKPYRKASLSPQLKALHAQQEEKSRQMREHLAKEPKRDKIGECPSSNSTSQ